MKNFLLPATATLWAFSMGLLWSCSATPPPAPAPPPPAPVPSLEELNRQYLSRIEKNRQAVAAHETRKEEIIARKRQELERERDLRQVRLNETETKRQKIELLVEQLNDQRAQLNASTDAARTELEAKIPKLEGVIAEELAELDQMTGEAIASEHVVDPMEDTDAEALFQGEMQPLYREGIELHLGFYRGVMDLANEQLTPGEEASTLVDHFADRLSERERLLDGDLAPDAFATLSHELELDRRMSQAWLSALILEVRFSLNAFRLDSISDEEQAELELLAESLEESWRRNPSLVMYIDGHADSRQFRGSTACVSATKNRDLSRLRAEAVRDYFSNKLSSDKLSSDKLSSDANRIFLDWFGNFSPRDDVSTGDVPTTGDAEPNDFGNRRIELRIATRRDDGSYDSHRDYFAMREALTLEGRTFRRVQGEWIESGCERVEANSVDPVEIEYLSDAFDQLAERLTLTNAATSIELGADGRHLQVFLGNSFTLNDGQRCVAVRPCPEP